MSNIRITHEAGVTFYHCPYCWRAMKSKGNIKAHINAEHQFEDEEADTDE